jgi:hypothetical protein
MADASDDTVTTTQPKAHLGVYEHYIDMGFSDDVANAYAFQHMEQKLCDELWDWELNSSEDEWDEVIVEPSIDNPPIFMMVNGGSLIQSDRYCAYCMLRRGRPHRHIGFFVSVPRGQAVMDDWREKLEVATHVQMSLQQLEKFEHNIKNNCVRIDIQHFVLGPDNTYSRNSPEFIEFHEPCLEDDRAIRLRERGQIRKENSVKLIEKNVLRKEKTRTIMVEKEKTRFLETMAKLSPGLEIEVREGKGKEELENVEEEKRRVEERLEKILREREKEKEEREREKAEREREKECERKREEEWRKKDKLWEREIGVKGKEILNDKMRELVQRFVKHGASLRGAGKMLQAVNEIMLENKNFKPPVHSNISSVVKEGAIIKKLQSYVINHRMEKRIMGQDSASSRSKTYLGLSSSSPSETVFLGMKQIVDHDEENIANVIEEMFVEFRGLAEEFPETRECAKTLTVESFLGIISDHAPVNKRIADTLSERTGVKLDLLGCSPHKGDLVETHLLSGAKSVRKLAGVIESKKKKEEREKEEKEKEEKEKEEREKKDREREVTEQIEGEEDEEKQEEGKEKKKRKAKKRGCIKEGEEEEYLDDLVGMKVPKGARSYDCSLHFLFTATNILSITGKDKYGFAGKFEAYQMKKGTSFRAAPLQGNRFLIYSTTAFRIYRFLPLISDFASTCMNPLTWSSKYLVSGCASPQTRQELRVLSLFAYGFSFPFQFTMEIYTVKQVSELWKVVEKMMVKWEGLEKMERKMEDFSQVWDLVKKNAVESVDEKDKEKVREKMERKQRKKCEKLESVFETWEEGDMVVWRSGMKSARREVQKIAAEYLEGGKFEVVSEEMGDFPGHNLFLESSFSVLARWDTHANHMSLGTLQGKLQEGLNPSLWALDLSQESRAKLRKMAREQETERERLKKMHKKVVERIEREKEKEEEDKTRKRKREEERGKKREEEENKKKRKKDLRDEKLIGVVLERDIGRITFMRDSDLKLQLMMWQGMLTNQKILLTMNKKKKIELLTDLIQKNPPGKTDE